MALLGLGRACPYRYQPLFNANEWLNSTMKIFNQCFPLEPTPDSYAAALIKKIKEGAKIIESLDRKCKGN